jgi:hypothetical protein
MAIYTEKLNKLNLVVSNSSNPVKITVDCINGTLVSVFFDLGSIKKVHCDETELIGPAKNLKGNAIEFDGLASNPGSDAIKLIHTIVEEGGSKIIYTFPDDYSGVPPYNKEDLDPSYSFFVNFI